MGEGVCDGQWTTKTVGLWSLVCNGLSIVSIDLSGPLGSMYEKLKHFLPQCDEERNKINKESRHKKELQSSFAVLCPPGQHRVTPGWSWTRSWELSSGGFLMTNNNHRPPFSECARVCVRHARLPRHAHFCQPLSAVNE